MNISPVTEHDLPELAALYQQLLPNDFSIQKMQQVLGNNRQNPNHTVLIAKVDGKVVGSLLAMTCEMLFGQCKSFMVIEDVVVDQQHRRLGVGTALLRTIEGQARETGCAYIMLITESGQVDTRRFYQSNGYKTDEHCAFKKHL